MRLQRMIPPVQRLASVLVFAVLCSVHTALAAADAYEAGRALAQRVYDRPDGRDSVTEGVMVLVEQGHSPRVRHMFGYRLDKGEGEVWSLIRFTAPPDIDGVGLLTRNHPGEDADQWLYLPALERTRRIASERKGGRFVGSDLFYEDLQEREVEMDRHRLLGREPVEGVTCEVLESVPADSGNSVYAKRVSWIHPQTLIALRTDFFKPGRDEPVKRLKVHRIERIQGYWTVMDSTMTDLTSGHSTRLRTDSIRYDQQLPGTLFERRTLEDPARELQYRP